MPLIFFRLLILQNIHKLGLCIPYSTININNRIMSELSKNVIILGKWKSLIQTQCHSPRANKQIIAFQTRFTHPRLFVQTGKKNHAEST